MWPVVSEVQCVVLAHVSLLDGWTAHACIFRAERCGTRCTGEAIFLRVGSKAKWTETLIETK